MDYQAAQVEDRCAADKPIIDYRLLICELLLLRIFTCPSAAGVKKTTLRQLDILVVSIWQITYL